MPAWARAARKYASRSQETQAQFITVGVLALVFVIAFFNSKKEDSSEEERIKSEVQRLVRLKKEFEDQETGEGDEDLSDDSMAAALRAAQEKMSEAKPATTESATDKGGKDGEGSGSKGGDDDTGDEDDDSPDEGSKDGKGTK